MTSADTLLAHGIAAARAGDRNTARQLLTRAVRRKPDSEVTWLWLSAVMDTPQGKIFCLQRVLALDPSNEPAKRGLAALQTARPAPTIIVQALPPPEPIRHPPAPSKATREQRFWQIVVVSLGIIALCMIGTLAYLTLGGARAAEEDTLAAMPPSPTPGPRGTLRPTFTPTPTDTPTPTFTPTPTDTPTPTHTPTPTDTPTPTPTPTRRRVRRATATATPTPTPRPTLPPRVWDPRLNPLGIRIESAAAAPGQPYWRLVEARWTDELESGGKHSIYVEVLDVNGNRVLDQPVVVKWPSGSVSLPVEDRPPPDWAVNFPMYSALGSYAVGVGGAPSDRVVGMGLGTAALPDFTIHTCFYLTFRWVYW